LMKSKMNCSIFPFTQRWTVMPKKENTLGDDHPSTPICTLPQWFYMTLKKSLAFPIRWHKELFTYH
jgi:hypothetical protein